MVVFRGLITKDEDDNLCIKMRLTPDNPEIYDIPLEEILEDYVNKKVRIEVMPIKSKEEVFKDD